MKFILLLLSTLTSENFWSFVDTDRCIVDSAKNNINYWGQFFGTLIAARLFDVIKIWDIFLSNWRLNMYFIYNTFFMKYRSYLRDTLLLGTAF